MATTFRDGDPSYSGALAGIALGLKSYHIFELKDQIPAAIWTQEMAMEELAIEIRELDQIRQTMRDVRGE